MNLAIPSFVPSWAGFLQPRESDTTATATIPLPNSFSATNLYGRCALNSLRFAPERILATCLRDAGFDRDLRSMLEPMHQTPDRLDYVISLDALFLSFRQLNPCLAPPPGNITVVFTYRQGDRAWSPFRKLGGRCVQNALPSRAEEQTPTWLPSVEEEIRVLERLPEDWDSYQAHRITESAISESSQLVREIAAYAPPRPTITPTSLGGIQLEWHENGHDIEVEIGPSPNAISLYAENQSGILADGPLQDRRDLRRWMSLLKGA